MVTPIGGGKILANYNKINWLFNDRLRVQINEISVDPSNGDISVEQVSKAFSFVVYNP